MNKLLADNRYFEAFLESSDINIIKFNEDLKIYKENISLNLEEFLNQELDKKDLIDVLFEELETRKSVRKLFNGILKSMNKDAAYLYFSLVPKKIIINHKIIELNFKVIDFNEFIIFLKDITLQETYRINLEEEKNLHTLIVSIINNREEFINLKREFEFFSKNYRVTYKQRNITELLDAVETYKGLLIESGFRTTYAALCDFEKLLKLSLNQSIADLDTIFKQVDLHFEFVKEIENVVKILGKDIFNYSKDDFKTRKLFQIETKLKEILQEEVYDRKDITFLINEVSVLNGFNLYDRLKIFSNQVIKSVDSRDKKLNPSVVEGDKNLFLPKIYEPFVNVLLNVYKNSVSHGLETFIERFSKNKQQNGQIFTEFFVLNNILTIEIKDDGRGIDLDFVRNKAIENNIVDKSELINFSNDDVLNLIFDEKFSLKENEDKQSKKGLGLSLLKTELEKINGKVSVTTNIDDGTNFKFSIPLKNDYNAVKEDSKVKDLFNEVVENNFISYLDMNPNIKIESKNIQEQMDYSDYYTCMDLSNDNEKIIIVAAANSRLIDELLKNFTQEELSDDIKLEMYQSVLDESLNTILGYVLSSPNCKFQNLKLSPPIILEKEVINSIINSKEKLIKELSTNLGKMNYLIFYS